MTAFACPHCGQRVGIPEGGQIGQRFQCPHCGKRISLAVRTETKAEPAALPADWIELDSTQTGEASEKAPPEPLSALGVGSTAHGLVAPQAATKRRRTKSGRWLIPAGILAGVVVVVAVTVWDRYANRAARHVADRTKIAIDASSSGSTKTGGDGAKNTAAIVTSLRPIRLLLAPAGVRVAIHLRPAKLWADSASSKSVRSANGRAALRFGALFQPGQNANSRTTAFFIQAKSMRPSFPSYCGPPTSRPMWPRPSG